MSAIASDRARRPGATFRPYRVVVAAAAYVAVPVLAGFLAVAARLDLDGPMAAAVDSCVAAALAVGVFLILTRGDPTAAGAGVAERWIAPAAAFATIVATAWFTLDTTVATGDGALSRSVEVASPIILVGVLVAATEWLRRLRRAEPSTGEADSGVGSRRIVLAAVLGIIALFAAVQLAVSLVTVRADTRLVRFDRLVELTIRQQMLTERIARHARSLSGGTVLDRRQARSLLIRDVEELRGEAARLSMLTSGPDMDGVADAGTLRSAIGAVAAQRVAFLAEADLLISGRAEDRSALEDQANALFASTRQAALNVRAMIRHDRDSALAWKTAWLTIGPSVLILLGLCCLVPVASLVGRQEAALLRRTRELEEQAFVLGHIPCGVVVWGRDRRVAWVNDAYCVISGYSRDELIGSDGVPAAGGHGPDMSAEIWEAVSAGRTWAGEVTDRSKDGAELWFDTTIVPMKGPGGEIGSCVAIRTDVTARKAFEQSILRSERRLASVIDGTGVGTWEWNIETDESTINEKWAEILGWTVAELGPYDVSVWLDRIHPEDRPRVDEAVARHFSGECDSYDVEVRLRHRDGRWIWVHDRGKVATRAADGRPLLMAGTHQDISARKEAEEALLTAHSQMRSVIDCFPGGIVFVDHNLDLLGYNENYRTMLELPDHLFENGMPNLVDIFRFNAERGEYGPGDPETIVAERYLRALEGEPHVFGRTRPDGRTLEIRGTPLTGGGFVTTYLDVTDREQAAERVAFAAHHDVLTGLANRAGLKALISGRTGSAPDGARFSMLLVDLDRFKAVNDTFGHAVGDRLLQMVAERMRANVRDEDVVARLGGDEFALYFAAAQDQTDASVVIATRLLAAISAPYMIEGCQVTIGASIGIAIAPVHGTDLDTLILNADSALYEVKATGRNGFRLFDEHLASGARDRRELENDLRDALGKNELELYYQPIVSVAERRIVGMEALLRWHHPRRGLVSPEHFVPIAEQTGQISSIGAWIIRTACRDAASWPDHVRVAVNVSPAQLGQLDFVDTVTRALLQSKLDPDRLELEVTETVLLGNDDAVLGDLHQLRSLGVRIALDDFGTGYSSLSYLRLFPFDKIKIDRSFVREIENSPHCSAIVVAVAGLARSLGLTTTAEGVETEEQFAMLAAAGCATVQGYLFGQPRSVGSFDLEAPPARRARTA
jgi:diguanylate cyclase (GGDEF)-like protein/PAS domain S-box-containing protein